MSSPAGARRVLSRRHLLRLAGGGLGAVGFATVARSTWPLGAGKAWATTAKVPNLPSKPATSTTTTPNGTVLQFRSRPDLKPAAPHLDINKPGQDSGLILMDSHSGAGDQGPMILDGHGQLVWFKPISNEPGSPKRAFNLRVQEWRGQQVLTWFDGDPAAAHGRGEDVIMSRSYKEIARVRAGNGYSDDPHEFLLTPEGTALLVCVGIGHTDLSAFGGKADAPYYYGVAQEVDVATGKVLFQWRSDKHVGFSESYAPLRRDDGKPWDYFHINSINLSQDGQLLISGRNTWAVYKVDRTNGKVLWRLGGAKSDFKLGPDAKFAWQHDANQQADGLFTVFDNGAGVYRSEPQSRGLVLKVDEAAREASLVRQYLHPRTPVLAKALGSVQFLPRGHVFIGWGQGADFTEFADDGAPVLDGGLSGVHTQSYRAFRSAWTGLPAEPPALAVERNGEAMTLYASWNGATEVSKWLVLGGERPSALTGIGVANKDGFETIIEVPHRSVYVAVVALGKQGHQLARSRALAT